MIQKYQSMEDLYQPSKWSKKCNPEDVIKLYWVSTSSASELAKKNVPSQLNVPYGKSARQMMDIFGAETLPENAPIFVFLHGGYWTMGSREDSSWMVEPLYNAGISTIVVGYDLAPKVTLDKIVEEINEAVAYIVNYANTRKSKGVYICGHSAGGNLASMALSSNTLHLNSNAKEYIKGLISISGIYDLLPLMETSISDDAKLTRDMCERNSPLRFVKEFKSNFQDTPPSALIVVGGEESPEYHRQGKEYSEALENNGFQSEYLIVPDEDHFSVVEKLQQANYSLTQIIVSRINA